MPGAFPLEIETDEENSYTERDERDEEEYSKIETEDETEGSKSEEEQEVESAELSTVYDRLETDTSDAAEERIVTE